MKEWIHFNFFSDRIYRMNWIFSWFPYETMKMDPPAGGSTGMSWRPGKYSITAEA